MKKNKFFLMLGAVAALSFAACSNEDVVEAPESGDTNEKGTIAYMTVVINAETSTRGTSGDTDLQNATDEFKVNRANFYLYTKEGAYVTSAQAWNGGEKTDVDQNVEFNGKTVLVLKDLYEKNAPAYLVTVLNAPDGFVPGKTLADMQSQCSLLSQNAQGYSYEANGEQYFTMSTSSYMHENPENNYEYFTTKVSNANFLKYQEGQTPSQDDINTLTPIDIYVERLAAKIGVKFSPEGTNVVTTSGGDKYFKLTVSGGNTTNTGVTIAEKDLYIKIKNWGLNNLTQNSYMMKNLPTLNFNNDNSEGDVFGWTNGNYSGNVSQTTNENQYEEKYSAAASNKRNYWALAAGIYNSNEDNLKHYSYSENQLNLGNFTYCFENTNTADILKVGNNLGNLATSAMIYACIYESNDGITFNTVGNMISYNGVMFKENEFVKMVLNAIYNNITSTTRYAKSSDGGTNFTQIEVSDVELVTVASGANKGEVMLQLTSAAEANEWYTYTGSTLPSNASSYTSVQATDINDAFKAVIEDPSGSGTIVHAYGYKDGLMYYNVPIEHYGPDGKTGQYGVVRNHIYELNIKTLSKLGKGIYDPGQTIIPDTPTVEDRYALGVKVNILSWKIVKQDIKL